MSANDVTATQVLQAQADTALIDLGVIPRPRPPEAVTPAYARPRQTYLIRLMAEAREASGKARAASERYNALAEQLEVRASLSHDEGSESQRVAMKFARSGNTDVGDADRQYQFWKGEQHRLCAMIAAEYHMMEMMNSAHR